MKVRLPLMVSDQFEAMSLSPDTSVVERFVWDSDKDYTEEVFLDGPVTSRVAILDFDEKSGRLRRSIRLDRGGAIARYDVPDGSVGQPPVDAADRGFQAVCVLGAVLHALHLYEAPDVLGRSIEWAFEGRQLLVVPRAGTWKNAYYERKTCSLQFFSFAGDEAVPTVHTSCSLDIVSHETGHAILDAIAPYLYDCVTPQSLGLHEAIGDLTTLFASLNRNELRRRLLAEGNDDIAGDNAYTRVAPAFGHYRNGDTALRTMWNDITLDTVANPRSPHALSEVLTGAIYELLVWAYDRRRTEDPTTGAALAAAGAMTRRVALRGLDYLPPGEVTFADYGRAILAADAVSNPDNPDCREKLLDIFKQRKFGNKKDLRHVRPDLDDLVDAASLQVVVESDWHAYDLVERNRRRFHVPQGVGFLVEPRLVVHKETYRSDDVKAEYDEVILKVSWEQAERVGRPRVVRFGSTVAFDRATGDVTAIITTNPELTQDGQAVERRHFVDELVEAGFLDDAADESMHTSAGLRLRGTGRTLHAARVGDGPAVDVARELRALSRVVEGPAR